MKKQLIHFFRRESGRMVAVLVALFGFPNIEQAEDIAQETLLRAMNAWKQKEIPDNPRAWLYKTAKNLALDVLRHEKVIERHLSQFSPAEQWYELSENFGGVFSETGISDSQLKMMFACCMPQLKPKDQVILILKVLCGLDTKEIAAPFFSTEEAIRKRVQRTILTIKGKNVIPEFSGPEHLGLALDGVLKALYLLFNEGYYSSGDPLTRAELCEEAIRLCILLSEYALTGIPAVNALLALMCFQSSRFDSRTDRDANLVLLKDQDRSTWNQRLIELGNHYISKASTGPEMHTYHLEAAIASVHCNATSFQDTDWKLITTLYNLLLERTDSAFLRLNRAIAVSCDLGPSEGLAELLIIKGLEKNRFYLTACADMYSELEKIELADAHYRLAMESSSKNFEKRLLEKRLKNLSYNQEI